MDLVEELKQHIAHDETIIVVGSGVSIQATNQAPCASWTGLLEDGVAYAVEFGRLSKRDAATTRKQIHSKDPDLLLSAAHTVTTKLGGDFGAWLQRSIGALRVIDRSVIEPLGKLGLLATTNYDHLLTEVTGLPPVSWTDEAAVEQVLRGRRNGILHLHGSYDDPESVILDVRSYERLVNSEHSQAVLTAIRTLKTLVFVGCGEGLSDPHFATFFKWTEKAFEKSHFPHFILCRQKEAAKIRKQQLPERKLHPVAYGKEYWDLAGFLASLAPPSASPPPRKTLPNPGPCFGRDDEIRGIVEALLDGSPVRIAVLGTAGLGKTTLTLTALHDGRVRERYGDAMYFIRCDAASSLDGLIGVLATELGVTGTQDPVRSIMAALGAKPGVLVLDNFETPWQSMPLEVEDFLSSLSAMDSLQLIVTLRGKERPAGVLWRDPVEPPLLSLPAARQEFLAIAGSRFADDRHLDALLEAMDRLPLAISLLAYVAQSEPSLDALTKRWQKKRTAVLQRAGGKQRLTNIEVSFELSIAGARMTDEARSMLSVLAVLPAGVAHGDLAEVFENGDEVASTLRATGLAFDEGGRLRMLAPLRAYVSDHYPPNDGNEERMTSCYVAKTNKAHVLGAMQGGDLVLASLPGDAPNIEAVLQRLIERGDLDRAGFAAERYAFLIRGTGVGSTLCLQLLAERAETERNTKALSHALRGLSEVALWSGRTEAARDFQQRILTIAIDEKDTAAEAWVRLEIGILETREEHFTEAFEQFEKAMTLWRALNETKEAAHAMLNLAHIEIQLKRFESAKKRVEEALPTFREHKSIGAEAFCLLSLARISLHEEDIENARQHCENALALFQAAGNVLQGAHCHRFLASICRKTGDSGSAIENEKQALSRFERLGDQLRIGDVHSTLMRAATDPVERAQHLAAARAAWTAIGRDDLVKKLDDDHPTAN
ncbi:MAG TPA: tetratricopeptide repeat protein [Thermoanaerobaculia bacterium]|nr:tetratricopeptide repeat protein [Thermoanaerobaculia bacterium]